MGTEPTYDEAWYAVEETPLEEIHLEKSDDREKKNVEKAGSVSIGLKLYGAEIGVVS